LARLHGEILSISPAPCCADKEVRCFDDDDDDGEASFSLPMGRIGAPPYSNYQNGYFRSWPPYCRRCHFENNIRHY